ncbi:ABC transporter substrate-binding protein [Kineococcus sp. SYSU DK001]|uniref:ABC transporter substrate-binding protein n=1 Tax=Kineococcus sp. SYSU DK001 TaxID=3383122 RepID=UPI003D7D7DEF
MMRKQHLRTVTVLAVVGGLGGATLTACSSGPEGGQEPSPTSFVSGGTFSMALNDDPGSLSPLTGVSLVQRGLVPFAYESMVHTTEDGEFVPWMAQSWTETPTSITYVLKDGITCADGTAFTAQTAANNIAYQADPANGTFWHGSNITEGMTATADGNELTITSPANNPFLLASTGTIEQVCQGGLDDPSSLDDATDGTGLFQLRTANAGQNYLYAKRDDHTWGFDGITSDTEGLPDEVDARVVTDEATAANLLLSGDLNAAAVAGSDRDRLEGAGLTSKGVTNPIGEMLFNERPDRPTADPKVRQALVTALDRETVGELVTNGHREEMTSLVIGNPFLCVAGGPKWTLPDTDVAAAGRLLDEAGWTAGADGKRSKAGAPLTIRFLYDAGTPSHGAGAEEVQAQWDELGVTTELVAEDPTGWSTDLYQTYDWDTGFIQLAPGTPVTLSLFFLGETAENGGYNFMAVQNDAYEQIAAQAATAPDADTAYGLWQDAEKELVDRVDIFPLAQTTSPTWFSGATADLPGYIAPSTIRMVG